MKPLSKKKKILSFVMVVVVLFTICGFGVTYFAKFEPDDFFYLSNKEEDIEFTAISAHYEESLWGVPDRDAADEYAVNLDSSSDGLSFTDVNYNDDNRASWDPTNHLKRLLVMIKLYGKDLIATNESVRAVVTGTLDYWLDNDFRCPNWWYNEIKVPEILADIGIMLKPHLSNIQIRKITNIVGRGSLSYFNRTKTQTGANMLDAVKITIQYAFFLNKPYLLKKATTFAENEIFISEGDTEGIKSDYTFYQHGAQQAIASYGISYVSNLAKIASLLDGTSFQFSEEKFGILVDFVLYGQRYAFRGNRSNYLTNGRSYSRINGNEGRAIKTSINLLLSLEDTPKKEELQKFYNTFENLSYSLEDTKYFPYSHTLFDISPNYYMGVKGAYQGFTNSELINSENILARNMAYGGLTLYQYTGYEYDDISALWDFTMLPGTTAYNETDEMLAEYSGDGSYNYRSMTTHSNGAADGVAGGLYVDIENEDGLYSRQAYITYEGLMICLGNSIYCSNSENTREIFTTVNQVYAKNATYQSSVIEGPISVNDSSAVFNGAFAYYNLGGGDLTAKVNVVTGNLNRNNLAFSEAHTGDIFKLYFTYGTMPENQTFAYAVLANSQGLAPLDADGLPIVRITNTKEIQAVEFDDGTAVVIFHETGTFNTLGGVNLSADCDCVKIFRQI